MLKRSVTTLVAFVFLSLSHPAQAEDEAKEMKPGEFLVFCYHAVPAKPSLNDPYAVPQNLFVEQMEYLRTHGYHPVSLDDILKASQGKQELPQKPVLLTFDDAYVSYYDFVIPVLEKFGYPSVLAVVGIWIDYPPKDITEPLMTWDQVREASKRRLVEVVSHTYDLHKAIQYNPPGNVGAAVSVRGFDPNSRNYETEEAYRARIAADFTEQKELFASQFGMVPRAVAWPYGRHNAISVEVAREAGICLGFTLEEGFAHLGRVHEINRNLVRNRPIRDFIRTVVDPEGRKAGIRALQVDLDLVYDPGSYEQTDKNLGKLIDRLVAMKVNTVFLQAFADPKGTGNIESVYFHNRVLPVRADIFSHAAHQMMIRDMAVYARYLQAQVRELLTDFGRIDILFLDFSYPERTYKGFPGKGRDDWGSEALYRTIRELAPDIILNNRLDYADVPPDIYTPEQYQPAGWYQVDGKPVVWETCQTLSGSWGYHRDEATWKSPAQLIEMLINCVACGGNLLMNVGPTARGTFDGRALRALRVYAEWMGLHGRAIYGCTQSDFTAPSGVRYTQNGRRLYAHLFSWPFRHLQLPGLAGRVAYAQLLNDASEIPFKEAGAEPAWDENRIEPGAITLALPVVRPEVVVPVVELFLK